MYLLLISSELVQKGFTVDLELVIVPVLTFSRMFEDISSCSDVPEVAFTGLFLVYLLDQKLSVWNTRVICHFCKVHAQSTL